MDPADPGSELQSLQPQQIVAYIKSVHAWLDNQPQQDPAVQQLQQLTAALLHALYGDQ